MINFTLQGSDLVSSELEYVGTCSKLIEKLEEV